MPESGCIRGPFLVNVEHLPSHLSKKNSGDYLFRQKHHFSIAGAASNLHWREYNQEHRKSLLFFLTSSLIFNMISGFVWSFALRSLYCYEKLFFCSSSPLFVVIRFSCRVLLLHTPFFLGECVRSSPQLTWILNTLKHLRFMLWNSIVTILWDMNFDELPYSTGRKRCRDLVRLCTLQVLGNSLWYIYINLFCCTQGWTFGLVISPNWLDK